MRSFEDATTVFFLFTKLLAYILCCVCLRSSERPYPGYEHMKGSRALLFDAGMKWVVITLSCACCVADVCGGEFGSWKALCLWMLVVAFFEELNVCVLLFRISIRCGR